VAKYLKHYTRGGPSDEGFWEATESAAGKLLNELPPLEPTHERVLKDVITGCRYRAVPLVGQTVQLEPIPHKEDC